MKSLKSLFALIAIATLSFGCASVTDASLTDDNAKQPAIESSSADNGVFSSGGFDPEPILEKPW